MQPSIVFRMEVFKENDQYVSLCPELNVSSFGDTEQDAEVALKEAVQLFIEQCAEMGTLDEVLEEAGFEYVIEPIERWVTREPSKLGIAEI